MTSWRKAIEERLAGRPKLTMEVLRREFWNELAVDEVCSALRVIQDEADVDAGLLRPADRLDELLRPPRTRNPFRWLEFQAHSNDGFSEISYQLYLRLRENANEKEWSGKVFTLDDFVRAWCGAKRSAGNPTS
ncbi:MAG TPA: hypothetical protein VF135_10260 [Terriglobales bacterium]